VSARWLCEQAWLPGGIAERVLIEVSGERIASVRPGADSGDDARRLSGLTVPGFANAHSHAFHRALRGRAQEPGDFWSWRRRMYSVAAVLDPDLYRELAVATYAEMALAGITTVGEFHYPHHQPSGRPYDDPNAMGRALIDAAREAGVRLTLLDACYLRAGLDGAPLEGAQARFGDGDAGRWASRVEALTGSGRVRVGAAVHSVRAVDGASIAVVADWCRGRAAPLHAHVSEQRTENRDCLATTGMTPAALLEDRGALGPWTTAVHCTHVEARDVERLGGAGASICLCPTTEGDLGDGIGPAVELARAGAPLCLGTDSQARIDMLEEARCLELGQRLRHERRGLLAPEALLEAATAGGARDLGWNAGRLTPGALADFAAIDTVSVRTAGADPASVVFAAAAADVTDVVVGGETVVRGGRHPRAGDVGERLARVLAEVERRLG
jgi:formiminoglutamate deiminase